MRRFLALIVFSLAAIPGQAGGILVIPFSNRTSDASLDWIGESLSETVREALSAAGLPAVRRQDRQDALQRLALPVSGQVTIASAVRMGEALEAALLVLGQFELLTEQNGAGTRRSLRVSARVLDLKKVLQTSEFTATAALEDLARLQSQLAFQVLRTLQPGNAGTREEFDRRHPAVKLTALENYMRGLMAPTVEQQHRYFTQAVRMDGRLWQPLYYLGRMHWEKENYREAAGWLEKIGPESPRYGEAMFMLGISRFQTGDYEDALKTFQSAGNGQYQIELLNNIGATRLRLGQEDEALRNFQEALQAVPADPDYHFNVGYALWKKGIFEEAAQRFRAVLDREPEDQDALLLLGRCLKQSGPRTGDLRTENLERLKDILEDAPSPPEPGPQKK